MILAEEPPLSDAEPSSEPRYHHGDLRAALLAAGEAELAEKGVTGFTLRGTAKRAGVSHAAPAHHFRDANALLTALAAKGFAGLEAMMRAVQAKAPPDAQAQLVASGIGYFRFGMENPALLQLMFGSEQLKASDPDLQASGARAFGVLVADISRCVGAPALENETGRRQVATAWSIVHGFTKLAATGQLHFLCSTDSAALEHQLAAIIAGALTPPRED